MLGPPLEIWMSEWSRGAPVSDAGGTGILKHPPSNSDDQSAWEPLQYTYTDHPRAKAVWIASTSIYGPTTKYRELREAYPTELSFHGILTTSPSLVQLHKLTDKKTRTRWAILICPGGLNVQAFPRKPALGSLSAQKREKRARVRTRA